VTSLLTERRSLKVGLMALVLVAVMGAAAFGYPKLSARLSDDAAFRYAGEVVTEDELEERVEILSALYGVTRPEDSKNGELFDRDAAKSMAVSRILEDAATDRDIEISDRQAQAQLDGLIDKQLLGGRAAFVDWLAEMGLKERDVLDEIKRQMATSRLVEEVVGDVEEVTSEEVRAAYDEHRDKMATPEARQLTNIVVETRTEAQQVARLAWAGEDFAGLVATWSRDGSTRDSGGDLGLVTADQLEASFAKAAFAAKNGSVFGPVQTRYGWNVGKVVKIQPSRALAFTEVEDELAAELQNRERLEKWRDQLGDLLEEADVEYADDYRPEDPTAPPSELPAASDPSGK
jgi:peptidyl-prolyl cis-trans isomerase C